jgi:hypothetical protein
VRQEVGVVADPFGVRARGIDLDVPGDRGVALDDDDGLFGERLDFGFELFQRN